MASLGLDPSDPLNLLVHNTPPGEASEDSSLDGSPPQWNQLASLWPENSFGSDGSSGPSEDALMAGKDSVPALDFDFAFPMNLDFDHAHNPIAVDPSSLHFSQLGDSKGWLPPDADFTNMLFPSGMGMGMMPENDPFAPSPFTMTPDFEFEPAVKRSRRESITSSSSSSGASLSPVIESRAPSDGSVSSTSSQMGDAVFEEIAQRVRQNAGVMLAVPSTGPFAQAQPTESAPAKLPIPRLPTTQSSHPSSKRASPDPSSASTSSAPSPAPSSTTSAPTVPAPVITIGPSGRPKTDHTTIERRYRTNLNTRIQSLKAAVPALRVLEAQKAGAAAPPGDVVDEHGFVDGVKVARKVSKANVLGKAVEYIRVLKKREARLAREQEGLRALVGGLVGGPALLKEWERAWRERFGGPERDQIEGAEAEPMSDDDDEDDDEGGPPRKKAKLPPKKKPSVPKPKPAASTPPVIGPNGMPEKRKRGRPRKNPIPQDPGLAEGMAVDAVQGAQHAAQYAAPPDPQAQYAAQQQQEQQGAPSAPAQAPQQQYLLAAFAFFSFLNSPLTAPSSSPAHAHAHTGSVLTHAAPSAPAGVPWRDAIQALHLLASAAVLLSFLLPWLPRRMPFKLRASLPAFPSLSRAKPSETDAHTSNARRRAALANALRHAHRGLPGEAAGLRDALGVRAGLLGVVAGVFKGSDKEAGVGVYELRQLEQRAWVRLGEIIATDENASAGVRLQTYWCMRSRISPFSASPADLSTLALVVRPLMRARAAALWDAALRRSADRVRPHERLVLAGMSADGAAARLGARRVREAPLRVLAADEVRARLRRHAAALFVRGVGGECAEEQGEEEECALLLEAGRSLGGRVAQLVALFERAWASGEGVEEEEVEDALEDEGDMEERSIRPIIRAFMLYRRTFPSCLQQAQGEGPSMILSPPHSDSPAVRRHLRRLLDDDCFEDEGGFEGKAGLALALGEAKDRVNDMLVERERAERRAASADRW